jgi:hypothetical protein
MLWKGIIVLQSASLNIANLFITWKSKDARQAAGVPSVVSITNEKPKQSVFSGISEW